MPTWEWDAWSPPPNPSASLGMPHPTISTTRMQKALSDFQCADPGASIRKQSSCGARSLQTPPEKNRSPSLLKRVFNGVCKAEVPGHAVGPGPGAAFDPTQPRPHCNVGVTRGVGAGNWPQIRGFVLNSQQSGGFLTVTLLGRMGCPKWHLSPTASPAGLALAML